MVSIYDFWVILSSILLYYELKKRDDLFWFIMNGEGRFDLVENAWDLKTDFDSAIFYGILEK